VAILGAGGEGVLVATPDGRAAAGAGTHLVEVYRVLEGG